MSAYRVGLVLLALGASACSIRMSQPVTAESEEREILEAREAQNAAIRARDLDRIARYWEEDVHSTAGTGVLVFGRDEYRQAFQDEFEAFDEVTYQRDTQAIELSTVDVPGAERIASESGTWTGSWVTSRGSTQMHGVYSAMWRKRNGRWRIRSELFVALSCAGVGC